MHDLPSGGVAFLRFLEEITRAMASLFNLELCRVAVPDLDHSDVAESKDSGEDDDANFPIRCRSMEMRWLAACSCESYPAQFRLRHTSILVSWQIHASDAVNSRQSLQHWVIRQ